MNVSELIFKLQRVAIQHGDFEVYIQSPGEKVWEAAGVVVLNDDDDYLGAFAIKIVGEGKRFDFLG